MERSGLEKEFVESWQDCLFPSSAPNFQWLISCRIKSWLQIVMFRGFYSLFSNHRCSLISQCPHAQNSSWLDFSQVPPALCALCSLSRWCCFIPLSRSLLYKIKPVNSHTHETIYYRLFPWLAHQLFTDLYIYIYIKYFLFIYPYPSLLPKRRWDGLWNDFKVCFHSKILWF